MQDYDVYYAGGEKFTEIKATCISKACRAFIDTLSKEAKYTLHSKEYASIRYTDNFSISADYVIMARSLN